MKTILSLAAIAAFGTALVAAAPVATEAATANSILANKKIQRADRARSLRSRGCKRERTCVAWAKGAPGTFVGACTKYSMRWSCPIKVN